MATTHRVLHSALAITACMSSFAAGSPKSAALALLSRIDRAYAMPGGLYSDELEKKSAAPAWPMGMLLDANLAAARVDRSRLPAALKLARALDAYRLDTVNGHLAYGCVPFKNVEHFFDDNAWLVLAFVEAYQLSKDKAFLDRATETLAFILTAEDDTLGGGMWWVNESRKSKHTCIVAPAALACLRVANVIDDEQEKARLVETALRLRTWLNHTLRDETDGLYFDNITVEKEIGRAKWTYNSAVPLLVDVELFRLTKDQAFLDDARRIADAGQKHWCDEKTGAIDDDAQFARWWVEALHELSTIDPDPRWPTLVKQQIAFVVAHDPKPRWHAKRLDDTTPQADGKMMDQAARVRTMLIGEK